MNGSVALHIARSRLRKSRKIMWLFSGFFLGIGLLYADAMENLIAYVLICCSVLWPVYLWVRMKEPGLPILPAVALMHLQYFAFPILKQNFNLYEYSPSDIMTAGVYVSLYLLVATAIWRFLVRRSMYRVTAQEDITAQRSREMVRLGVVGLCFGLFFQLILFYGLLAWTGSVYGVIRSVAFSLIAVSCFFLGIAWGHGGVRIKEKCLYVLLTGCIILLTWSTLFLVLGTIWLGTMLLGYFISSRRIPVFTVISLIISVAVLHAGKAEMRSKYWGRTSQINSVSQLPSFYMKWVSIGVDAIHSGEAGQTVFDRVSLLQMLLRANARTPEQIDFLFGKTYAVLPALLVPRFLWKDKPTSQSVLNMLNIRYGLVSVDEQGEIHTSIGWGVIAEGYVNFGVYGIIGIGMVMGLLMGAVTRWSSGRSAVSFPTLYAAVSMVAFVNLELDFTYLCTILFQSFFGVLIFYNGFKLLVRTRKVAG